MFKKVLFIILFILPLVGCTGDYDMNAPVSPSLEEPKEPEDFYNTGWEINDAVTANAVDNLMGQF